MLADIRETLWLEIEKLRTQLELEIEARTRLEYEKTQLEERVSALEQKLQIFEIELNARD